MIKYFIILLILLHATLQQTLHFEVGDFKISKHKKPKKKKQKLWLPPPETLTSPKEPQDINIAEDLHHVITKNINFAQTMVKFKTQTLMNMKNTFENQNKENKDTPTHLNDEKYIPPVRSKLPERIKKALVKRLKKRITLMKGKLTDQRIQELKNELIEQFRRYGIIDSRKEVEDIFKGVNSRLISKNFEGPYFDIVEELKKQTKERIKELCNSMFNIETKIQMKNCVQNNFDLLVLNMILNIDPKNHPIIAALQNEVYHGEQVAMKDNVEREKKRTEELQKKYGGGGDSDKKEDEKGKEGGASKKDEKKEKGEQNNKKKK